AGRGVMGGMSVGLASGLRVVVGLVSMTVILAARGMLDGATLIPAAGTMVDLWDLLGLAILSGGVPLVFYFYGLSRTKASTAGYFEMMQTLAALLVTWGVQGDALRPHQCVAGALLIVFVALLQRAPEPYDRLSWYDPPWPGASQTSTSIAATMSRRSVGPRRATRRRENSADRFSTTMLSTGRKITSSAGNA